MLKWGFSDLPHLRGCECPRKRACDPGVLRGELVSRYALLRFHGPPACGNDHSVVALSSTNGEHRAGIRPDDKKSRSGAFANHNELCQVAT